MKEFEPLRWEWSDAWSPSIPSRVVPYTKYLLQHEKMLARIAQLELEVEDLKCEINVLQEKKHDN